MPNNNQRKERKPTRITELLAVRQHDMQICAFIGDQLRRCEKAAKFTWTTNKYKPKNCQHEIQAKVFLKKSIFKNDQWGQHLHLRAENRYRSLI